MKTIALMLAFVVFPAVAGNMPTVDDLRKIIRQSYSTMDKSIGQRYTAALGDLDFAHRELRLIGRLDVIHEEHRRYELQKRGFSQD